MELSDVVRAMIRGDALLARQWVFDALESGLDWSRVLDPDGLTQDERAVAAGFVELMAERSGVAPPAWTSSVGPASQPMYLVPSARVMRRTRERCEREGPWPFRSRRVLALPNCFTFA